MVAMLNQFFLAILCIRANKCWTINYLKWDWNWVMCESRNEIVSYSLLCRPLAIFRGKFMILTLWNSSLRYGTYVPYRIPFGLVYSYCVLYSFFIFLSCFVIVSVAVAGCVCFFFCIRFILPLREILSFGICISASLDPTHSHKRVNIEHIINFHVNAIYRHKRKRWKQKKIQNEKAFLCSLVCGRREKEKHHTIFDDTIASNKRFTANHIICIHLSVLT